MIPLPKPRALDLTWRVYSRPDPRLCLHAGKTVAGEQQAEVKSALPRYLPAIPFHSDSERSARTSWASVAAWVIPAGAVAAARLGP